MQIRVKSVSVLLVLLRKNLTLIRFGQKIVLVLIWCTSGLHGSYGQFGAAFVFKSVPRRKSCLTFSVRQLWMFISSCQFWILTCVNKTCKTPKNSHVHNHASPFLMRCLLLPFFGNNHVYIEIAAGSLCAWRKAYVCCSFIWTELQCLIRSSAILSFSAWIRSLG
jgi:hypothetical protein